MKALDIKRAAKDGVDVRIEERAQSACLLDNRQMMSLFPDSLVSFERVGGIPKSLIARRFG